MSSVGSCNVSPPMLVLVKESYRLSSRHSGDSTGRFLFFSAKELYHNAHADHLTIRLSLHYNNSYSTVPKTAIYNNTHVHMMKIISNNQQVVAR